MIQLYPIRPGRQDGNIMAACLRTPSFASLGLVLPVASSHAYSIYRVGHIAIRGEGRNPSTYTGPAGR